MDKLEILKADLEARIKQLQGWLSEVETNYEGDELISRRSRYNGMIEEADRTLLRVLLLLEV